MVNTEIVDTMVRAAMQAMENAYVPYGKVSIGACVLASDGTFYTGCNIENTIPKLSAMAEEVAMYRAVADGKRDFDAIAVIADMKRPLCRMVRSVSCWLSLMCRKSSWPI
jgi:cytidine deaminase